MSRYIDADALLKAINKNTAEAHNERCAQILEAVLYAPTADVVEVRHGEWKKVSEKYPRYVCTCCNHLYNNKEYKYCPNCGAKMDGERREEVKPCPLCGREAEIIETDDGYFMVQCSKGDCIRTSRFGKFSKSEIVEIWNRRTE